MVDLFEQRAKMRSEKESKPESGDIFEQRAAVQKRGGLEKTARTGAQYGLGLLDRATLAYSGPAQLFGSKGARTIQAEKGMRRAFEHLSDLKQKGVASEEQEKELEELQRLMENPESYREQIQAVDRTPSGLLKQGIKKVTGYDLEPEGGVEKTAEFLGSFTPKELIKGAKAIPDIVKGLTKKTKQLFPSGLSKPRAVESKLSPYSTIGKKTQKEAVEKLNKEAGSLAKEKVHEHLPVAKQIEQGVDFKSFFSSRMSNLEQIASKSKARVDLTPVEDFLEKTADRYRGVPKLHKDAVKIASERKAFYKNPPVTIDRALKTYRSNNRKINEIFEKSRLHGTQKEYADFLIGQNKAIAQSFRDSFGAGNKWVKDFERLNAGFKSHADAQKTLKELDGFFGGRLTPRSLEKLGSDPRTQQKLSLMMGDQGAKEIAQIAKDLKAATDAVKGISKVQYHAYEAIYPITYLIPIVGKVTGALTAMKISRNLLGSYLSKPAYRRAYSEALSALKSNDMKAYERATAVLKNITKDSEEDQE